MRVSFADFDAADYLKSEEAIEGFLREAETAGDPQHIAKAKKIADLVGVKLIGWRPVFLPAD